MCCFSKCRAAAILRRHNFNKIPPHFVRFWCCSAHIEIYTIEIASTPRKKIIIFRDVFVTIENVTHTPQRYMLENKQMAIKKEVADVENGRRRKNRSRTQNIPLCSKRLHLPFCSQIVHFPSKTPRKNGKHHQ